MSSVQQPHIATGYCKALGRLWNISITADRSAGFSTDLEDPQELGKLFGGITEFLNIIEVITAQNVRGIIDTEKDLSICTMRTRLALSP